MKKAALLVCLLVLACAGSAFGKSEFSLGIGGQYWDAKDADKLGEHGFGGANLIARYRANEYVGFDVRLGASGIWDADSYRVDGTKYETDAVFMCCPLELGLVLMWPVNDWFTVYGGPGIGYYYYDIDVETTTRHGHHIRSTWSEHIHLKDDFGWYAVGGATFQLARHFSLFGEARYTDTETKLRNSGAEKIDCSGFGVQLGCLFDF